VLCFELGISIPGFFIGIGELGIGNWAWGAFTGEFCYAPIIFITYASEPKKPGFSRGFKVQMQYFGKNPVSAFTINLDQRASSEVKK
jgi:hypothetical protein